jgi:hypothetical protein
MKSSQADSLYSSSTTNFTWLSPTENWLVPESYEFCHLYSRGTDTHQRKHMSRDHHPQLRDVTSDMENTASSTVACWTVFTELLPGNAPVKSVTIFNYFSLICLLSWWLELELMQKNFTLCDHDKGYEVLAMIYQTVLRCVFGFETRIWRLFFIRNLNDLEDLQASEVKTNLEKLIITLT